MNSLLPWYRGPRRCERQLNKTAGVEPIYAAACGVVTNAEGGRSAISASRSARDFSDTRLRTDLVGMLAFPKKLVQHPRWFAYEAPPWAQLLPLRLEDCQQLYNVAGRRLALAARYAVQLRQMD